MSTTIPLDLTSDPTFIAGPKLEMTIEMQPLSEAAAVPLPAGVSELPYDFLFAVFDKIKPEMVVGASLIVRDLVLLASAPESKAACETAPAEDSLFNILVNEEPIGVIRFNADEKIGIFTVESDVVLAVDDVLKIKAQDAENFDDTPTMENVLITIVARYTI